MKTRTIVGQMIVGSMLACSGGTGPDGPGMSLSFFVDADALLPSPTLEVDVGGETFRLGPDTRILRHAPSVGELPVSVALHSTTGAVATESFLQTFRDRHDHWIGARVGTTRPVGFCIGPPLAIPLESAPDTLFVYWGGIPEDAVC